MKKILLLAVVLINILALVADRRPRSGTTHPAPRRGRKEDLCGYDLVLPPTRRGKRLAHR
jgi:hypothetical protein